MRAVIRTSCANKKNSQPAKQIFFGIEELLYNVKFRSHILIAVFHGSPFFFQGTVTLNMSRTVFFVIACLALFAITYAQGTIIYKGAAADYYSGKKVLNLPSQCFKSGHFGACKNQPNICKNFRCGDRNSVVDNQRLEIPMGKADDGTHCGDSSICRNGLCVVVKPEEIKPEHADIDKECECLNKFSIKWERGFDKANKPSYWKPWLRS